MLIRTHESATCSSPRETSTLRVSRFNPTRNALAGFRKSVLSNSAPAASVDYALITARTVQLSLDAMDSGSVVSF